MVSAARPAGRLFGKSSGGVAVGVGKVHGQRDNKLAARPRAAFHAQPALMQFHQTLGPGNTHSPKLFPRRKTWPG